MNLLNKITIQFPDIDPELKQQILNHFHTFGLLSNDSLYFKTTQKDFYPLIQIEFKNLQIPIAEFVFNDEDVIRVELLNKTGLEKKSPHRYTPISMAEYMERMRDVTVTNLDHAGFDLPWFEGVHPEILDLREKLKKSCLYYLFPTGEAWDFILPGTQAEIETIGDPSFEISRKPKFEIVSIDKVSVPIVQFELEAKLSYSEIVQRFPEGIAVPEVKNVWVYIKNSYGIDICFVLNEAKEGDWSGFFKGKRIK